MPRGGGSYLIGKPYSVNGRTYYPSEKKVATVGLASWYGDAFHGRRTSNGEVYDRDGVSAASPTMPLPSYARVTNLRNNYSMIVRVNDRGPFVGGGRIMDVSRQVAQTLDFHRAGTTKVKVEYIAPASLAGSDDRKLLATLRQDGPAMMPGEAAPVMVAQQAPPARVASVEPIPAPPLRRSINETQGAPTRVAEAGDTIVEKRGPASAAPLPPSRPFDLGTIPGAGVPIGHLRQALAR